MTVPSTPPSPPSPPTPRTPGVPGRRILLWALLLVLAVALAAVLVPFYGPLLWALIISLLFTPMYRWLLPRLRRQRTVAALVTLLVVLLVVVLPFVLLILGIVDEATGLYAQLQSTEIKPAAWFQRVLESLPAWLADALRKLGLGDIEALQERLASGIGQLGQMVAARALQLGQDTFSLLTSIFLMLYVAFFFIRDGRLLRRKLQNALPLGRTQQHELLDRFTRVIGATVRGNLLVASLQGALGVLAFWVLGFSGALLWGVVMGFLSLLPAVGAALVWGPVALYLLATGEVAQGLGLAAWGMLVIGLVDNLLRPMLVGKDSQLPDWLVLISTLGGFVVFGMHGFVIGPLVVAMFMAVWQMTVMERASRP